MQQMSPNYFNDSRFQVIYHGRSFHFYYKDFNTTANKLYKNVSASTLEQIINHPKVLAEEVSAGYFHSLEPSPNPLVDFSLTPTQLLRYLNNACCRDSQCIDLFKGTAFTERDHYFFHVHNTYHSKQVESLINCIHYAQQTFSLADYKTIYKHLRQQGTLHEPVCNYRDLQGSTTPGVVTRVAELLSGATAFYTHSTKGLTAETLPVTKINEYISVITTGVPLIVGYTLFANPERQPSKDGNALANIYNIPKELYPAILANPNFTKHSPVGKELLRLNVLPSSYWKN